jgi:hypothetical protein
MLSRLFFKYIFAFPFWIPFHLTCLLCLGMNTSLDVHKIKKKYTASSEQIGHL